MRISAGSAGALATDADVLCLFLCVILVGPSFCRCSIVCSRACSSLMPQLNQRLHKLRTERIHRMVANGWATLSYQSLSFFYNYWYHKNSTLHYLATSSSSLSQLSSITLGFFLKITSD